MCPKIFFLLQVVLTPIPIFIWIMGQTADIQPHAQLWLLYFSFDN